MKTTWAIPIVLSVPMLANGADHFDDHDFAVISKVDQSEAVQKVPQLTATQISRMPHPLVGHTASSFLVVHTDRGNWCKLLVRQARIKGPQDQPVDLLLVERLVTYPMDSRRGLEADRSNIYLFPDFALDLDSGQIVPAGHGEDLTLVVEEKGPTLRAAEKTTLYAVGRPMVAPSSEPAKRKFGQGALMVKDFAGEYQLQADGRWSGKVVLDVDDAGNVTGTYTSDQTGQTYDIQGRAGNPTNKLTFKIVFPMTEQQFEGYLWSRDRSRICGITHMEERPFGFVMDRN